MSEILLELNHLKKSFGETGVLRDISLAVHKGEFITLLGASGCGKTTTLRIIAGLETPDSGSVILEGKDVTFTEPDKRNVNTVFQNYALFPHMTVFQNVAYGLKIKKTPKDEIARRVADALELVQLTGYEKRSPSELSGGQMQRVAIARAVVNNPEVLLLDEPLGALDLQLRRQMQTELKRLQKQLGITFIYITHDQEEAINMSDRIVVMRDGVFEQIGGPAEIYDHPKTSYVAQFVGNANIIKGTVTSIEKDKVLITCPDGRVYALWKEGIRAGEEITVAVRSENLYLAPYREGQGLKAVVKEKSFVGGMLRIVLTLGNGEEIISSLQGIYSKVSEGEMVSVCWEPSHGILVDLPEPSDFVEFDGSTSLACDIDGDDDEE